jgi:hypothetical protein
VIRVKNKAGLPEKKSRLSFWNHTKLTRNNGLRYQKEEGSVKKLLIAVVAVTAIITVTIIVSYRFFQIQIVRNELILIVQNITIRTTNELNSGFQDSNTTYQEYFNKLEKDLWEIDTKLIDIQILLPSFNKQAVDASLIYGKSCRELLHALLSNSKKYYALKLAIELSDETARHLKQLITNDDNELLSTLKSDPDFVKRVLDEQMEDIAKITKEQKKTVNEVIESTKMLELACTGIKDILPNKCVIDNQLLSDIRERYEQAQKELDKDNQ